MLGKTYSGSIFAKLKTPVACRSSTTRAGYHILDSERTATLNVKTGPRPKFNITKKVTSKLVGLHQQLCGQKVFSSRCSASDTKVHACTEYQLGWEKSLQ